MTRKRVAIVCAMVDFTLSAATAARDLTNDQVAAVVKDRHILALDKLEAAALAPHAGGAIQQGAEVGQHRRGCIYEVEVTDAKGIKWEMEIDVATGKILKNKRD